MVVDIAFLFMLLLLFEELLLLLLLLLMLIIELLMVLVLLLLLVELVLVVDQVQVVRVEGLDGRGLHVHQRVLRGDDAANEVVVDLDRSLGEGDRQWILAHK